MKDLKQRTGKNTGLESLVPGFVWELGLVQTHGDTKYAPGNWREGVIESPERYQAALLRHLLRFWAGETVDPETGLHHMAHIACNAMYLYWADEDSELPKHACVCALCQPPAPTVQTETRHVNSPRPLGCVPPATVHAILPPQFKAS